MTKDKNRKPSPKKYFRVLLILFFLFVLTEIFMRYTFGLSNPPLYTLDNKIGYYPSANQHITRFRNQINYNNFSLRGPDISENPQKASLRILCVGDSVMNGGVQVSDYLTIPAQIQNNLQISGVKNVEVLNASAGGWSLINEKGFLQEKGLHKPDIIIFQVNTGDMAQKFSTADFIVSNPNFPTQKPPLAWVELLNRYVLPKIYRRDVSDPGASYSSETVVSNECLVALGEMIKLARKSNSRPAIWYVRERKENRNSVIAEKAFVGLSQFAKKAKVPVIDLTGQLDQASSEVIFRDQVHPSAEGNKLIGKIIAEKILKLGFIERY